jgi:hypothetical protein
MISVGAVANGRPPIGMAVLPAIGGEDADARDLLRQALESSQDPQVIYYIGQYQHLLNPTLTPQEKGLTCLDPALLIGSRLVSLHSRLSYSATAS